MPGVVTAHSAATAFGPGRGVLLRWRRKPVMYAACPTANDPLPTANGVVP
jgi:hypothetical protein